MSTGATSTEPSLHSISRPKAPSTRLQKIIVGVSIVLGLDLMLMASLSRFNSYTLVMTTPWGHSDYIHSLLYRPGPRPRSAILLVRVSRRRSRELELGRGSARSYGREYKD